MNFNYSIEQYSDVYQEQVSDLILHIQQVEYNIEITKEDQPDLLNITSIYQIGKGNFWLAIVEGKVIGTISLLDIGNNQVALRKMFVDRRYRGSEFQVAKKLLNKAIDWGNDNSIQEIYLGTTPQFKAAHRFYQKNGFTELRSQELPSEFPIMKVDNRFYKIALY
ncbi:GNAT family N-acetyltransferase [Guptibacillus hwajinpoensis]|uniref:N-acetylglutamate synthase-like GNAT family acetyltransferase n=1 Tax=Guptibacillus hwajinpoensis TaxID=208199 RepID=A0ABU0K022_9BACL|nr:GNAT family N-acetyltransferase [Alkalihalobacillus hemicentroti]MDQ0481841.1 N-acetylglutamate synthase-like GNAT family acetyltransferase [Alkalihalobacillus hemicentroti]